MREKAPQPIGWCIATLPDLIGKDGTFVDGDWVESKDQDPNGDIRLIQLADIGDGVYRDRSSRFLTKEKAGALKCTYLKPDDVLVARMPDPLGRACIFPGDQKDAVTVVDVCIVRAPPDSIDHRWLAHTINSPDFRAAVRKLQSGTTRQRISRMNLSAIPLPVPPVPEQHRIVAAIEQQFTRLNAGVAALKRSRARLKRYRATVLKSAVEGELTAEWRKTHPVTETGAELLQRILAERRARWEADLRAKGRDPAKALYEEPAGPDIETLPTVPDGWCWASLGALSFRIGDVDHRMPKAVTDGIAYISTKDFRDEDYIDFDNAKRISEVDYSSLKRKIHPEIGDLLLSRYGTIGEIRRVSTDIKFQASYSIAIIKTLSIPVLGFYLSHVLKSASSQASMRRYVRASSQPDLGLEYIRLLPVPVPSLAEQSEIVAEVERRLSVVNALEASIEANLKRAERLRQSILREAFAGRLVPQDPTDEPASILLERIRTARTEKQPSRGRRLGVQQLELVDAIAAGS